jgi:hypothetical protein
MTSLGDVVSVADETHGFRYFDDRDETAQRILAGLRPTKLQSSAKRMTHSQAGGMVSHLPLFLLMLPIAMV